MQGRAERCYSASREVEIETERSVPSISEDIQHALHKVAPGWEWRHSSAILLNRPTRKIPEPQAGSRNLRPFRMRSFVQRKIKNYFRKKAGSEKGTTFSFFSLLSCGLEEVLIDGADRLN